MKTLLLPNGYGKLEYLSSLEHSLNARGFNAQTLIFPGQNGKAGSLSIESAAVELESFLTNNQQEQINIIAHCSAAFPVLRSANNIDKKHLWRNVKNLIIYSYLANPSLLEEDFRRIAKQHMINLSPDANITINVGPEEYFKTGLRITVIHPRTTRNKIRANQEDLSNLSKMTNVTAIKQPAQGYEIVNKPQTEDVNLIVDNFYCNILS